MHQPIAVGTHWSSVMSLLTGVWKPEGEGKRMRGEMHINHVSSIYKPDALTSALRVYARHTLFTENMTMTTWLSHLALVSCTPPIRRNPPPRGTLFNYKPANRIYTPTHLPFRLSFSGPLYTCPNHHGPEVRQVGRGAMH